MTLLRIYDEIPVLSGGLIDGGFSMVQDAHVISLEQKHKNLEVMIAEEEHRPHPDTLRLSRLKKKKLRLKEEICNFANA